MAPWAPLLSASMDTHFSDFIISFKTVKIFKFYAVGKAQGGLI